MAIERSVVMLRMKSAIASGMSASGFIKSMRAEGLSYRRQTMLADWRSEKNIGKQEGLLRFVRKDLRPTAAITARVTYDFSREFMHKVKVHVRTRPGEPITEHFVNVMADRPLSPREIEQAVLENLVEWSDSIPGIVERITPWTIIRGVVE